MAEKRWHQNVNLQAWIQDLVNWGPQLLRLKVADLAKRSHVSNLRPG